LDPSKISVKGSKMDEYVLRESKVYIFPFAMINAKTKLKT